MKTHSLFGYSALTLSLLFLSPRARADEVQVSDSARQHFKTGVAYLTDPDGARYEEAYREFVTAYADSPSWKILGNLGISAMKLERDGEAVDAFEKYLAGGGAQIDPAERGQMERDLMTTKSGLVWVTVKVAPAGATLIDERQPLTGRIVTNRYDLDKDGNLHFGVRRGHHKMTAQLSGYENATWEFDGEPGADQTHSFTLEPPKPAVVAAPIQPVEGGNAPAMKRPIGTPVIIGVAATGALLVGSGVVGVLAMGKKSDFNKQNDGLHVDAAKSAHDSAQTLNIVGDALLGGAVIAGAITTYLFVTRPEVPAESDTGKTARRFEVVPTVGSNAGGFVMSGNF
jgi:hypothetical protein